MKFRYKNYGSGVLRPVIPVELIHKDTVVPYEVLVDSGSDICIFDSQIGGILGIDTESGEPHNVGGITGAVEKYYVHQITIQVVCS